MNKKQIVAKITSIGKRAETLRNDIQEVLIATVCHVVEHGEVSLYDKLLNATKGANRVGIHVWIKEHGGAIYKDGKFEINATWLKDARAGYKKDPKLARAEFEKRIEAEPLPLWYEDAAQAEEEPIKAVWDALTKAESLIADIAKKTKKGEGEHLDVQRYLRAAIEQYRADRAVFDTMAAAATEEV